MKNLIFITILICVLTAHRLHASSVRASLGLAVGRVLRRNGFASAGYIGWQALECLMNLDWQDYQGHLGKHCPPVFAAAFLHALFTA